MEWETYLKWCEPQRSLCERKPLQESKEPKPDKELDKELDEEPGEEPGEPKVPGESPTKGPGSRVFSLDLGARPCPPPCTPCRADFVLEL